MRALLFFTMKTKKGQKKKKQTKRDFLKLLWTHREKVKTGRTMTKLTKTGANRLGYTARCKKKKKREKTGFISILVSFLSSFSYYGKVIAVIQKGLKGEKRARQKERN